MDEENSVNEPTSSAPIKPKNNKLLLIVIGILVIIVIIALAYLLGKRNSNTTTVDETSPTIESTISASSNTEPAAPALTSETSTATADWKTYTNDTYGFSFKYPDGWRQMDEEWLEAADSLVNIGFENPNKLGEPLKVDGENIFMYVFKKNGTESLSDWLIARYRQPNTELESYQVGKAITMGGISGYISDIGCCASVNKDYVVEKGGYVYELGTNSGDSTSKLQQIATTFQFTK